MQTPLIRFIVITLAFALALLGYGVWGQIQTSSVVQLHQEKLSIIDKEVREVNRIHGALSDLYQDVDSFLLDPTNSEIQKYIKTTGFGGLEYKINKMMRSSAEFGLEKDFQELRTEFIKLTSHIEQLIQTRLDPNIQYPGMALSAEDMAVYQDEVNSALELLVNEIEDGEFVPTSEKVYPLILKIQTLWAKSISQVRTYLANRLASFSTQILELQYQSLNALQAQLQKQLKQLDELYQNETESFAGRETVQHAMLNAQLWLGIFDRVHEISISDHWREDTYLKETLIIPSMRLMYQKLDEIRWSLNEERHVITRQMIGDSGKERQIMFVILIQVFVILLYMSLVYLFVLRTMLTTNN